MHKSKTDFHIHIYILLIYHYFTNMAIHEQHIDKCIYIHIILHNNCIYIYININISNNLHINITVEQYINMSTYHYACIYIY